MDEEEDNGITKRAKRRAIEQASKIILRSIKEEKEVKDVLAPEELYLKVGSVEIMQPRLTPGRQISHGTRIFIDGVESTNIMNLTLNIAVGEVPTVTITRLV